MNKKVISFFAVIGGIAGGYVPVLFGDSNFLDGWSILAGFIGGIAGIVAGVYVSRYID